MIRSRYSALALATVAAAAATGLQVLSLDRQPPEPPDRLPEVSVAQPRWTLFNTAGEPEKRLQAERMEQWAEHDAVFLSEPRLQLRDRQQRHWLASAEHGRIFPDERPIQLQNNVVLRQVNADTALHLSTEELRISRNGERVETDAAVVLNAGNWHFSAVGMRADLGSQRVELLNRVQGSHE